MLTITHTSYFNPDFKKLIELLDKEYMIRYPYFTNFTNPYNILDEQARVILVYDNTTPIACGAFRPVDNKTIEIKRMYTLSPFRNRGIGKQVVRELEQWARSEGFSVSILETGINQPEAIATYEKSGYVRTAKYPPYVDVQESICMKKSL